MAQIKNSTSFNRHPALFSAARMVFCERARLRLLSFGCSFGHEMASLRAYFPPAEIHGCDVHDGALEAARRLDIGKVFNSTAEAIAENGPYDGIFALSVLCIHPPPKNISTAFPFRRFVELIGSLDGALSADGLLCIVNANYRFDDHPVRSRYRRIFATGIIATGRENMPLLSPSGEILDRSAQPSCCIFQKNAGKDSYISAPEFDPGPAPAFLTETAYGT